MSSSVTSVSHTSLARLKIEIMEWSILDFSVRDSHNFLRNILWRQKINTPTGNGALRHIRLVRRIKLLRDSNTTYLPNAA